jgi:hypothetical protein
MTATYFDVHVRTIDRYVSENAEEISINGYEILKGKRLKNFLECVISQDVTDINVGNISNPTPQFSMIVNIMKFIRLSKKKISGYIARM